MKKAHHTAPGKSDREGITLFEVMEIFPDEQTATKWFENVLWPEERCCGKCDSTRTCQASHAKMPYWCSDCRSYFSVRTGTALADSKVPLRKWAIAIYLELTGLKGISSMKLHRDIGVSQPTAWFMLHRIRTAWETKEALGKFKGPVEVDETYVGGKRKNMRKSKRLKLTGRGTVGKTAVVGAKDRATNHVAAKVVDDTTTGTLQGFVVDSAMPGAKIYTDDSLAYWGLPNHEAVTHSTGEYVRGKAHTNGIESFWSMLKRAYVGTFHKISPKHLDRYVREFAGKHNLRDRDTLDQLREVVLKLVGKRLMYRDLIADNGLCSGSRS